MCFTTSTLEMPYKVLLYEDNAALRNSIMTMFQWNEAVNIVAGKEDADQVLEDIDRYKPDIILMDIDMPKMTGIDALKILRNQHADIQVIMLTVFEDDDNIFNAICAGANGYLLKKNIDQILPAIMDAINGGAPMTSSVAKKVLSMLPKTRTEHVPELDKLTERETEILGYLVKGYSYKMIAAEMIVAIDTVRSHIKHIYKKLQVNSATEAIYKAKHTK